MSSRKEVQNHNMFSDIETNKELNHKQEAKEAYADKEKMMIPRFENQVARDSAWSQRTDTR